ncbi:prephenate dehydratase PHA2 [Aspergillus brunneoviolaceus CBS 621.78]|uniref:prephenate dehydratase n=2 Tax=Aspergillus TaxID=5052 RepID=A0A8G1VTL5_9EURO|nr:chorismate mutase/prephenate dehydratase [Aspergillus brunneoviolaceus CBS 621.78]XP_040796477.1 chorismate mutase/prephenate dehydratase [Aspergillus fijiensis CBS 313.89]RAH48350.1 chorismate mutase/prephenate dehydratase [Aspergillus brunneoviolaceus CBS 621.78]RAK72465.1 chorismate mutase/prephenate dehydratase [Aspergillus fijiensis CBS 313.89]
MEQPIRVTFLGPIASFSHQAAVETFGSSADLLPCVSFADAFAAVQEEKADYAIIPCENSTNGSVVQTLDLLADPNGLYGNVKVCGEHYLTIHHCLLTRKGDFLPDQQDYGSISRLYTHPQAWGQCDVFLEKNLKGVERQDVSSTSKGAEIVSKDRSEPTAAIASRFAAEYHGLDILAENIEDNANNTTRFLVLMKAQADRPAAVDFEHIKVSGTPSGTAQKKTLISFMVPQDRAGALADALLIFKTHGMNLTSINSRPSQVKAWKYMFLVEGHLTPTSLNADAVSGILHGLKQVTEYCRYLGTWTDQLVPSFEDEAV